MKDRLKKALPWVGGVALAGLAAYTGYQLLFKKDEQRTPVPTVDPGIDGESVNSVAGGQESTPVPMIENTPTAVIVSTQPPVDISGIPYKGSDSCRIVAKSTGEVFYITRGRPSMIYGYRCLGRDENGVNWWLARDSVTILQTTD